MREYTDSHGPRYSKTVAEGTVSTSVPRNPTTVAGGHNPSRSALANTGLAGPFNSDGCASVFQWGEHEDTIEDNSGWAEGDWNGDGDFDSSDFSFAFGEGGYDQPNRGGGAFATHQTIIGYTAACRPRNQVAEQPPPLVRSPGRSLAKPGPIGFAAGDANVIGMWEMRQRVWPIPSASTGTRALGTVPTVASSKRGPQRKALIYSRNVNKTAKCASDAAAVRQTRDRVTRPEVREVRQGATRWSRSSEPPKRSPNCIPAEKLASQRLRKATVANSQPAVSCRIPRSTAGTGRRQQLRQGHDCRCRSRRCGIWVGKPQRVDSDHLVRSRVPLVQQAKADIRITLLNNPRSTSLVRKQSTVLITRSPFPLQFITRSRDSTVRFRIPPVESRP